ncbi:hypothetical protein [Rhizobium leguminosarum]|uniref:hypothetical protein n=1 Tax=Rhizobium leguminosarum TaxID=384 RepID=UPI000CF45AA7|nr:hypothetical protein [Rhizobium leguminosarum]
MEWTITIEGKNESATIFRREVRIDRSWKRLLDEEVALAIEESMKFMAALQSEAETYSLSSDLPGLPRVPTGQGLHGIRDARGAQSPLGAVPGLSLGIAGAFAP